MKRFGSGDLRQLRDTAAASPRLRSHRNWHDPLHDPVQRFWIQLHPGTYVRPHRHIQQQRLETTVLIAGHAELLLFDDHGQLLDRLQLAEDGLRAVELSPDQWHSYIALAPTTLFEVKQGPYEASADKQFADWAPAENTSSVTGFLQRMKTLTVGETLR